MTQIRSTDLNASAGKLVSMGFFIKFVWEVVVENTLFIANKLAVVFQV
jgi:hypothetical protein